MCAVQLAQTSKVNKQGCNLPSPILLSLPHTITHTLKQDVAEKEQVEQALKVNRCRLKKIHHFFSGTTFVKLLREGIPFSASHGFEEDFSGNGCGEDVNPL